MNNNKKLISKFYLEMTTSELIHIKLPKILTASQQNSEVDGGKKENKYPNTKTKMSPTIKLSTSSSSKKHDNLKSVLKWPIIDGKQFFELLDYFDNLVKNIDQKFVPYQQTRISENQTFGPECDFDSKVLPILDDIFGNRIFGKLDKTIGSRRLNDKNNIDLHWFNK